MLKREEARRELGKMLEGFADGLADVRAKVVEWEKAHKDDPELKAFCDNLYDALNIAANFALTKKQRCDCFLIYREE